MERKLLPKCSRHEEYPKVVKFLQAGELDGNPIEEHSVPGIYELHPMGGTKYRSTEGLEIQLERERQREKEVETKMKTRKRKMKSVRKRRERKMRRKMKTGGGRVQRTRRVARSGQWRGHHFVQGAHGVVEPRLDHMTCPHHSVDRLML